LFLVTLPANAQTAYAQPTLPAPRTIHKVGQTLAELDPARLAAALDAGAAHAQSCTMSNGLTCAGLVLKRDSFRVASARWTFLPGRAMWRDVVVTKANGMEVAAASWISSPDATVVRDVRFESPGAPALRVRELVIDHGEASRVSTVRLRGLSWSVPDDQPVRDRRLLSATLAEFDGEAWRIQGVRVPGGPGPWKLTGDRPALRGGLLPPRVVHAGGDVTEFEATAVNPMSGFARGYAGYLRGTHDDWYGLGLGLVGEHQPSQRGLGFHQHLPIVTLGAIWRPGARPALTAEGDAVFGDPLTHAAASLETPGYREAWRTQSIRRGAFFRPWSHSRAGFALHGEAHVLRASAFESRTFDDDDARAERSGGARAGFGTEHTLSERAQVGLEVRHVSVSGGERDRHISSIRADVMVDVGDSERAFARFGGLGRINTRLVPTDVGFGAGTAGGLYATARGGLSFTGVFDDLRHRIRPSVFAISEVVDFEKTASEAISDGGEAPVAVAVASQAPKPWHSAGVSIDQRLSGGDWTFDLPAEVFAASFGTPSSLQDALGASAGLDATYSASSGTVFSTTSHVVCERACQNIAWDIAARLDIGSWSAAYSVSRVNRLSQRIADLQTVRDAWSRILAFEVPASSLRVSQSASVGWERRRVRVDVTGVTNHSDWGLALEPDYAIEALGWSVGLTGFYDSFDREWGVLAGLSGR
jgi:hypothetical protein